MDELLSRAMYLVLLRTVFFLATVLWLLLFFVLQEDQYDIQWQAICIVIFSSILVHQITYAFAVPFLCDNLIDLLWLGGDVAGLLFYAITNGFWYFDPEGSQLDTIQNILLWCLVILLPCLLISRICLWFQAIKRVSKRPFNLRELKGVGTLFGNSLWKERLIGETKKLTVARGLLASLLLAGFVAFFLASTLTGPFQELHFVPIQNSRTPDDQTPYGSLMYPSVWGVTFGISNNTDWQPISPGYTSAVNVTPLWDNTSPVKPACVTLDQDPSDLSQLYGLETQISTVTYYCPSRPNGQNEDSWLRQNLPQTYYNEFQPDLLITVNFTTLGMPIDSIVDIASNSIQVMVTMTNNTADVVAMTTPTILVPGVNLVGLVSMEVHQTFTNPGMATLGLFENVQSTLIGQVARLYPDLSSSPLITRAPEIATLRLSVMRDATQWNIIRDTKKNTFLSGFSKIGGLWTFLSGIFAAIFGSSLIRILFGIKPISVFGLAHRWERGAISKAYRAEYPAIQDEMSVPRHQRGLLCLIQDHIVDLDLIDEPVKYSDVELESKTKSMEMLWP